MDGALKVRLACLLTILHDLEFRGVDPDLTAELEADIFCLRNPTYEPVLPSVWGRMGLKDLLTVIRHTPNREHLMGVLVCTFQQL